MCLIGIATERIEKGDKVEVKVDSKTGNMLIRPRNFKDEKENLCQESLNLLEESDQW